MFTKTRRLIGRDDMSLLEDLFLQYSNWCGKKNEPLPHHIPRSLTKDKANKITMIDSRHPNKKQQKT